MFEVDAVEEDLHIFERVDGDAAFADFAFAGRVIGVVAHQRGQIEGDGESAAAVFEKIFVALVGFFGRGEAGEHAHRPQLAAVAGRVNAARVGRLAGIAEVLIVVPVGGKIGLGVEAADRDVRDGAETRVAMLVEVGAGGSADRLFGSLVERGRERFLRPLFFGRGGMPACQRRRKSGFPATVLRGSVFSLFSGIQFPTSVPIMTLMIEEDRHAAKWCDRPSGW